MTKQKIKKEFGTWISLRSKRPPEGEDVIMKGLISSHNPGVDVGHWKNYNGIKMWESKGCCSCSGSQIITRIDDEVEYWMPLPEYED